MVLPSFITDHMKQDVLYWVCFALGEFLFLLRRADLAARSPLNAVKTKRDFFKLNWVTILIRMAFQFVLPFYVVRHYGLGTFAGWIGWTVPSFIPAAPQNGVFFACLGFVSDGIMDSAVMRDKVAGIPIPSWLKENIPQLPVVQQLVAKINGKT